MASIQQSSIAASDEGTGAIDWDAVRAASSITQHWYTDDAPNLRHLVQFYGGGIGGQFIEKLTEFVTAAVLDNRRIPSYLWAAFAKLKVDANALCPFVIWAIVKAEAKAAPKFVLGGMTNFIKPPHINSLAEKSRRWSKPTIS